MRQNLVEMDNEFLRSRIRAINDYPKQGIVFRDITPLIKDAKAFGECIDQMAALVANRKIGYVIGTESRGFIFGAALAYRLGKGFVIVRKKGKLPHKTISRDYALEYGNATLEMHIDAIERGSSVLIVDDLLATGGTARAVAELVENLGGSVSAFEFVIELADLKGREKLSGYDVISMLKY